MTRTAMLPRRRRAFHRVSHDAPVRARSTSDRSSLIDSTEKSVTFGPKQLFMLSGVADKVGAWPNEHATLPHVVRGARGVEQTDVVDELA